MRRGLGKEARLPSYSSYLLASRPSRFLATHPWRQVPEGTTTNVATQPRNLAEDARLWRSWATTALAGCFSSCRRRRGVVMLALPHEGLANFGYQSAPATMLRPVFPRGLCTQRPFRVHSPGQAAIPRPSMPDEPGRATTRPRPPDAESTRAPAGFTTEARGEVPIRRPPSRPTSCGDASGQAPWRPKRSTQHWPAPARRRT